MTFQKGEMVIRVEQIDGFGKNPSLWVGTGNERIKVASFGNPHKAEMFCAQMAKIFFNADEMNLEILGLNGKEEKNGRE